MGTLTPAFPRRPRVPSMRLLGLGAMLLVAVAWAFAWGAHEHGPPATATDLSAVEPDRRFTIDASTGVLDLSAVAVQPGEVVEFVLEGSAGAPHQFLLTGLTGAEMDTTTAGNGDTVIRLRAPEDSDLSFFCAIPGHEGLHGSLVVSTDP
ncbi:MAG: hypothetical protein GEU80_02170 [Dehalococcoidia bacterium]|nr:hypothetical protein [Dehalococcoidia bacterium]